MANTAAEYNNPESNKCVETGSKSVGYSDSICNMSGKAFVV